MNVSGNYYISPLLQCLHCRLAYISDHFKGFATQGKCIRHLSSMSYTFAPDKIKNDFRCPLGIPSLVTVQC